MNISASSGTAVPAQQPASNLLMETVRLRPSRHDVIVNTVYDNKGKPLLQTRADSDLHAIGTGRLVTVTDVSKVTNLRDKKDYDKNARLVARFHPDGEIPSRWGKSLKDERFKLVTTSGTQPSKKLTLDLGRAEDGSTRTLTIPVDPYSKGRNGEVRYTGVEYVEGPNPGSKQPDQVVSIELRKIDPVSNKTKAKSATYVDENNALTVENRVRGEPIHTANGQLQQTWKSQAMIAIATDYDTALRAEKTGGRLADWKPGTDGRKKSGDPTSDLMFAHERRMFDSGRLVFQTEYGPFVKNDDPARPLTRLYKSVGW